MDVDVNPNVTCAVCGESEFHLKEGFYYCNECGTKSEQVRALELENGEEFVDTKGRKTQKIKTDKSNKLEPTSWECYNYILRGIVEELIDMGAKDELKVMVLQVWAAYLRTLEVAFFNRKHAELPKLGVRFEQRDANILYNHIKEKKKRKKDNDNVSVASSAKKQWRKHMKNLDQSQYEASMSAYSQSSFGDTSFNSSGSAPSNRAIRLNFSNKARKRFKKRMSSAHLKKHEHDFNNQLKCHKIRVKRKDLRYPEVNMDLNMKQLYGIVIIALNLIEDDIQLTDFMRFVSEGHISTRNVERFFPENLSMNCKEALTGIRFHMKFVFFTVTNMREHCGNLCKALHITTVKTPDILKLIQRYILELFLPSEIYTFIERLINLYPPKMEWNKATALPSYESRAMAYIIFTLKLLFGLDGRKEKQISRSARRVNFLLTEMGITSHGDLFVWDDWVEYIEMRKVILCTHNLFFCKQFKETPAREMYLHKLSEECIKPTEKDLSKNQMKKSENMEIVFKNYLQNINGNIPNEAAAQTRFTPSFTPCLNYFKRIQLDSSIKETIPDFMYVDYTKHTLTPFLRPVDLQILFSKYGKKLDIVRVGCTSKLKHVGTFSNPVLKKGQSHSRCIRFNDNKAAWEEKINKDKHRNTTFRYPMERYGELSLRIMRKRVLRRQGLTIPIKTGTVLPKQEIMCNRSIDLFSEDNMEPSQLPLSAPRRFLEKVNLFEKLNDDEDFKFEQSLNESLPLDAETTTFKISNMDCWTIMGKSFELTEAQANEVKSKMPVTFFWLLETCANTLGVSWLELYDQLMVLEIFFGYTIQPLNDFKDRIIFEDESKIKDINKLIRYFKSYW